MRLALIKQVKELREEFTLSDGIKYRDSKRKILGYTEEQNLIAYISIQMGLAHKTIRAYLRDIDAVCGRI